MEIHAIARVAPGISVNQLCRVPLPSHLVLRHLVSWCVKPNIQHSAQMEQVVPLINVEVAVFRSQTGLVYSTWQIDVIQQRVVVLQGS